MSLLNDNKLIMFIKVDLILVMLRAIKIYLITLGIVVKICIHFVNIQSSKNKKDQIKTHVELIL